MNWIKIFLLVWFLISVLFTIVLYPNPISLVAWGLFVIVAIVYLWMYRRNLNNMSDIDIAPGDYVIDDRKRVLQVKSIEEYPNGNRKYWFTNGRFGLHDDSHLLKGLHKTVYKKVDVSQIIKQTQGENNAKT